MPGENIGGGGPDIKKESKDNSEHIDCIYHFKDECPAIRLFKSMKIDLKPLEDNYCSADYINSCPVYVVLEDHRKLGNLEAEILASLEKWRPEKAIEINNIRKSLDQL